MIIGRKSERRNIMAKLRIYGRGSSHFRPGPIEEYEVAQGPTYFNDTTVYFKDEYGNKIITNMDYILERKRDER